MARQMWFGPCLLELKSSNLGGKAVDYAFHFPGTGASCLVGSLSEVTIVLALAAWWSWSGADVCDAGGRERAQEVAGVQGGNGVFGYGRRHR